MPALEVNGGLVEYELLGEGSGAARTVLLTPGGRFSKDIDGLRPLAEALVEGGLQVLLWDRPNTGVSDVQFSGPSESHMRADTAYGLITGLGLGRCVIAGGSGGGRDSLITAMLYPQIASHVVVWNLVGGVYGSINLASFYLIPSIRAVRAQGIEGVLDVPEWKERVEANPRNRDRLLAWEPEAFKRQLLRWLDAFVPKPGQTIPGVPDDQFHDLRAPTLIIRGGKDDLDHPARTSLEVSTLVPDCTLVDPPWPEDAWDTAMRERAAGKVDHYNMFDTWVQAAPLILDFVR